MGKSSASTGGGIAAGDGSDIMGDEEDQSTSQKVLGGIGGAINGALSSMDQQPQMVQAGPQLGGPVNQPQQMQDPYAQNIAALDAQKKKQFANPQVDFFGNPTGSGY